MDVSRRIEERTLPANEEARAVHAALAGISAPSEATLDLLYRHRFSRAEVARVSGIEESAVEASRVAALEELADALGVTDLRVAAAMLKSAVDFPPEPPTSESSPEPVAEDPAVGHRPSPRNRRSYRVLLAALVTVLAVTAIAIGAALGGGDESDAGPAQRSSVPDAESSAGEGAREPERVTNLSPLPGAPGRGSIEVTLGNAGTRVADLEISGLPQPDGRYEAWLYTSVLDSVSLGSIESGEGTIEGELPQGARGYEFLDVSIQSAENDVHSGRSIFRVPTAAVFGE